MASPILAQLEIEVTRIRGVIPSAIALLGGIKARIDEAVAAALVNGATEAELAPFGALSAGLASDTDALAVAVQANQA